VKIVFHGVRAKKDFLMDAIRRFLWRYLGITLDRETYMLVGFILLACIAACLLGFVPAISQNQILRVVCYIATIPGGILLLGCFSRSILWGLSNKEERRQIETDIALRQLKKHVRATRPEWKNKD
jgi:hypothetical protein